MPEISTVEHVSPAREKQLREESVIRQEVKRPSEGVQGSVEHHHVPDESHDDWSDKQSLPLSLALDLEPPEKQRKAEDAEDCGTHQDCARDHPLVGLTLCLSSLVGMWPGLNGPCARDVSNCHGLYQCLCDHITSCTMNIASREP